MTITWNDIKEAIPSLTKEQLEAPVNIITTDGAMYFQAEQLNMSEANFELGAGVPLIAINFDSWETPILQEEELTEMDLEIDEADAAIIYGNEGLSVMKYVQEQKMISEYNDMFGGGE